MCGAEDNKPITNSHKLQLQWHGPYEASEAEWLPTSTAAVCLPLSECPVFTREGHYQTLLPIRVSTSAPVTAVFMTLLLWESRGFTFSLKQR